MAGSMEGKPAVPQVIYERRSIRRFRPEQVGKDLVTGLLEAGIYAPTAGNLQPWEFHVAFRQDLREALARAAGQGFVSSAPVVIVVCAISSRTAQRYGRRGLELYCLQDTAAAVQNILLAAAANGLGTCWIGAFNEEDVRRALNLPEVCRPVAIIPVGYPDHLPKGPGRRPLDEVVRFYE